MKDGSLVSKGKVGGSYYGKGGLMSGVGGGQWVGEVNEKKGEEGEGVITNEEEIDMEGATMKGEGSWVGLKEDNDEEEKRVKRKGWGKE